MGTIAQPSNVSGDLSDANAGAALDTSAGTLTASIATAFISFGVQFLAFYILRWRLTRIYRPKTYMVAERQRVPIPPNGIYQWLVPLFSMPNSTIINKCGLDAYFFLRYLRMLLKIFIPMAVVILPILLPINRYSGNLDGVNSIGWQNIAGGPHTERLWAHLILAIMAAAWFSYVVYQELRSYIRIRQAYLTSPQHRIRASATTVLVRGIPRKWLSLEALNGLYDVFPGGIRNIWINRDFDELLDKVNLRNSIARNLESAETNLIKLCIKKHKKAEAAKAKQDGRKVTKKERQDQIDRDNEKADRVARGHGMSSGNPHQMPNDAEEHGSGSSSDSSPSRVADQDVTLSNPLTLVTHGFGAFSNGLTALTNKGKSLVGGVTEDVNEGVTNVDNAIDAANTGGGFVVDHEDAAIRVSSKETADQPYATSATGFTQEPRPRNLDGMDRLRNQNPGLRVVPQTEDAAERNNPAVNVQPPSASTIPSTTNGSSRISQFFDGEHANEGLRPDEDPSHRKPKRAGTLKGITAKVKAHKKPPALDFPSPQPHIAEGNEFPLQDMHNGRPATSQPNQRVARSKWAEAFSKTRFWKKEDAQEEDPVIEYPKAYIDDYTEDQDGQAEWSKYIEVKDRETMRLPIFKVTWFPSLPFIGQKVDKIYHLRKELARLNAEVEADQNDVERFPLMNSAFIQFNHQIAAHMACQSVSHHIPQHMAPRHVEIAPQDVIWSNMSIKWWERYIRQGLVIAASAGLIFFFAIPIGFTGALSQISGISRTFSWLGWLETLPPTVISIIQGILPPLLLAILLILVPIIFRALVRQQGVPTSNEQELGVQQFYFFFLFVQVFLVVTLSAGLFRFLTALSQNPAAGLSAFAENLPRASNYFFSYMIVQALSTSAGTILQVVTLLFWFVLGPILDTTARQKWARQTTLQNVQWGSYFPPFTNFAVIGLVFSIISPLIMVFNLITFSLFWLVQRYNVIYVYQFTTDTGGLLFPQAVNQLFAGIYVMEICLAGLFFITVDDTGALTTIPQGIIMVVMIVATALFQVLVNAAFKPLLRYLPITLEDDAVERDEEFARSQAAKFRDLTQEEPDERSSEDIEDRLEDKERREEEAEREAEEAERQRIREHRSSRNNSRSNSRHQIPQMANTKPTGRSWKHKAWDTAQSAATRPTNAIKHRVHPHQHDDRGRSTQPDPATSSSADGAPPTDPEAQRLAGDVLFSGFADELEDLTPEERDSLVRYAFQHEALRARRPVVWIPRDPLGVSDDEIARSKLMSTTFDDDLPDGEGEKGREQGGKSGRTFIWMSNEGTALDGKARVVFKRSPPDFASSDLIAL